MSELFSLQPNTEELRPAEVMGKMNEQYEDKNNMADDWAIDDVTKVPTLKDERSTTSILEDISGNPSKGYVTHRDTDRRDE